MFVDLAVNALAPIIWGSTYLVTTLWLPQDHPITVSLLRALPAGLLLLAITRRLPFGVWCGRSFLLGGLNFTVFWICLFVAAYRLPGGVAATLGAVQPLMVMGLQRALLGTEVSARRVAIAVAGLVGVALLVLTPKAALDPIGVAAGLIGATSMALGSVLTRKWQPPVPLLAFTGWQMSAGGILLLPLALVLEPSLPPLSTANILGLVYLALVGGAVTYVLWFRGLSRLEPAIVAPLGFLSPLTAVVLGVVVLDQTPTLPQALGMALILGSVALNGRS